MFEHEIVLFWHEVPINLRRKMDEDYDKNHPDVPKEDRTLRVKLAADETDPIKVKAMLIGQLVAGDDNE